MTKILLIDDHAIVRQGVRELLAEELPGAEFGEAASGEEAAAIMAGEPWSLAILDVSMPKRGGIDALKDMRAAHPEVPVLVYSQHTEEQYAIRALRAGAAGYVGKDAALEELVAAAKKALSGGKYVSERVAQRLGKEIQVETTKPLHSTLSDRELQVLEMLAKGRAVKEIGVELNLSEKTISTYRARILEKMNLKTNADLMLYAFRVGLVE